MKENEMKKKCFDVWKESAACLFSQ
jgi:hypothetical protein